MMKRHFLLILSVVFGLTACGSDSNEPFKEGVHYRVLKQYQPSQTKQVAMFFSSVCPACYGFDRALEPWLETKSDDVVLERIPVLFNKPEWLILVRLYATLRVMNIHEELSLKMFEALQEKRLYLGDAQSVAAWLSSEGYDGEYAKQVYKSKHVDQLTEQYSLSEKKYDIRYIPRVIVNGNIEIIPQSLKSEDEEDTKKNLAALLNFLLAEKA